MKYNLYCKYFFFIFFAALLIFSSSNARTSIENDIKNISSKLRCMTCQNQTIHDSDAEFSMGIKKIIKKKLEDNESDKEIINFIVERYGEYILFEPKINKQNIFLWLFPFIILLISLVFLSIRIKKNT